MGSASFGLLVLFTSAVVLGFGLIVAAIGIAVAAIMFWDWIND